MPNPKSAIKPILPEIAEVAQRQTALPILASSVAAFTFSSANSLRYLTLLL